MRAFRMYRRVLRSGRIDKHRDYIGEEKLHKYGPEVWKMYNHFSKGEGQIINYRYVIKYYDEPLQVTRAELAEMIDGQWVIMQEEEAIELIFKQT